MGRLKPALRLASAVVLVVAAVLLWLHQREARAQARTAEEFIEEFVDAYRRGDVDAILAMKVEPAPATGAPVKTLEERRRELEESRDRRDLWWRTWERVRYDGETDHGDHIHVDVIAGGGRSEVVLVRDGEFLRIHPKPSSFDGARCH